MKLIGITGSCGKTSVAEIVYQYLLYVGYKVSLYCSNGLFVNGLTREKDFFQSTLYGKELDEFLKEDVENEVNYAIVEITAESVKRNDTVHLLPFDVVALTNFYRGLHNHFDSKEHYLSCKRKILTSSNVKEVLLRLEEPNYNLFSDIKHLTYGYSDQANYQLKVLDNKIDGLHLIYDGVEFRTNLITGYHARNMACALAILSCLNILDINAFKKYAQNIYIRGRFERLKVGNKNIVIDTGFVGADMLLLGLEQTVGNTNFKIIYSSVHYNEPNEWIKNARSRVGEFLRRGKFIYLTNPKNALDEEDIFIHDVMNNEPVNYRYIPTLEQACKIALDELKEDETLVIFAREHYRKYRHCFENIQ
ncbi:MAG TPA: Mur ligase family protein [Haloplasmataceae bacterium]